MAGKFLRHARTKSIWGTPPARSAEVHAAAAVDPDPAKRAPSRKDTRHYCKGKAGREHTPEIVRTHDGFHQRQCGWVGRYDYRLLRRGEDAAEVRWLCTHEEHCSGCGKILRAWGSLDLTECPVYPGSPEQRAEAEREAAEYPDRYRARLRPRRAIDGPQGYRKKRQEAR